MTRGAPSRAQYGVHDGGGDTLRGALRDTLRGALRGTLRGALRGALRGGFRGPLGGHLKGCLKGSGAALSLRLSQQSNSASTDSPLQRIKERSQYGTSVSTLHR